MGYIEKKEDGLRITYLKSSKKIKQHKKTVIDIINEEYLEDLAHSKSNLTKIQNDFINERKRSISNELDGFSKSLIKN